jgi:hypothetical protein
MSQARHLLQADFVGREAELGWLEAQLASSLRRSAGAVAIIGDAGIGKTRLTDAVVAAARLHGVRVVRGGAYEIDEPLPYSVPSDMFTQWMGEDPAVADFARDPRLFG